MTVSETLLTKLEGIVGAAAVWRDASQCTAFAIAAHEPAVVVQPDSVEQAAEVVALAGRERLSMAPWGQGTQMHLGKAPTRYDLALSLAGLTRMIEYDMANLIVIAEAGLPLREMYKASVPRRQFLPLGFPGTMASLGGLLVTNTSGVKGAQALPDRAPRGRGSPYARHRTAHRLGLRPATPRTRKRAGCRAVGPPRHLRFQL